jgi:hypothetical protein
MPVAESAASGKALDLLDGHLTMPMPEGAVSSARQPSIMAAPVASRDETRVLLEPGSGDLARFVMVVTELYTLGTGDIVSDATKLAAKDEHASALTGSAMTVAKLEPGPEPPGDHPIFLLSVIDAHPDGTLQETEFYILPEMKDERAAYAEKALAIAKTIKPGARTMDLAAHTAPVDSLEVDVPKGFVVASQPGEDFDVYWVRKVTRVGDKGATLGLYFGDHPSFQFHQADLPAEPAGAPGTLLGTQTTWYSWTSDQGVRTREAMTKLSDGRFLHAFEFAGDDAGIAEVTKVVETVRPGAAGGPAKK